MPDEAGALRFSIATAYIDPSELTAIARAADERGYHAMTVADHVVNLAELETEYPYTEDGKRRWEPFHVAVGESAPTVRLDYWKCPGGCNQSMSTSHALKTALPTYVVLNDIPGMIFDAEDLSEFERFVRSMDMTEVANRDN